MQAYSLDQPANGFAWIVTDVILASVSGLKDLGFTGIFSKSSNASKPSITLKQSKRLPNCFTHLLINSEYLNRTHCYNS